MAGGIKVQDALCVGCANCIKSCPTEAMRVIEGCVQIIPELCIDCGECMRNCPHNAITIDEDDWELIHSQENALLIADPTFYVQMGAYRSQSLIKEALSSWNVEDLIESASLAYDVVAFTIAKMLEKESAVNHPLISTYCPAVIRLIQIKYPELTGRLVPVDSPLEVGISLRRELTGNHDDVTLLSPCPAKITLVRSPVGRKKSNMKFAVSVQRLVRALLAGGPKISDSVQPVVNNRWLKWSIAGGESSHIKYFSERALRTISVAGLRNTMDLLKEMELGRLRGIDYIECRACDLGCIGGVGNAESRFLSKLRIEHTDFCWDISDQELSEIRKWSDSMIWKLEENIGPSQKNPLSDDLNKAMERLKELNRIYSELPNINCGSCGRPSCRAMAEDVVRGRGEVTDCIFKLRETITDLGREIVDLSEKMPHTLRGPRRKR